MNLKKIVLICLMLSMQNLVVYAHVRNIQDNFQVVYNVIDSDGNHVTGQTVTLRIKKVSNGNWFDFNDSTFKSSSWTNKTTNLTEDTTDGFYYYTFNPPASETSAEQYQFLVDNASETYGDHQSQTVTYNDIGTSTVTASGIADAVWDEARAGHVTSGTFGEGVASVQGNVTGSAASVAGAVGSVTAGVTVTTNNDKTGYSISGTKTTLDALNDLSAATVNAQVDTALSDIGLDHLLSASVTGTDITDNSIIAKLVSKSATADWDSFNNTTDSLEALRDRGDAAWITATGFSTHSAADVWAFATRTITGGTIDTNNDKTGYRLSAAGVDDVWDEAQSGHSTAGTFGKYLDAQVSAVGGGTAAQIADAVWDEAISGHATAGTFGTSVQSLLNYTDGDKESGNYSGIEALIRKHGN